MATLYSSFKFLAFQEQLDALKEGRVAAPVHVRIKPINRCNHNCWYCAYRYDELQLGEDIDLDDALAPEKMFEIADDLIDMGVKAVTFSGGGEPLLYKPLPDVIDKLAGAEIKVATLTNGSNLKGRMADAFAKHGTWVRVSLDAWDDESYAKSRSIKPGAYTQLLENMRAFVETGTACVLGASLIIDEVNHAHIFEVCEKMRDAGVNHVKLSPVVTGNDVAANNAYHQRIGPAVAEQIEKSKRLNTETFTVIDHYHELPDLFDKGYHTCSFLMFLTVIGADAKVYSCQDKAYTETGLLGSIADRRFKDFWFSEENKKRLYGLDPTVSCRHHCVAHGKNLAINEFLSLDPEHGVFV